LPEALEKGWPQRIDFNEVPKRVESMKSALEDIIANADNCSDNEGFVCDDTGGPRARSIFWRELQNEIKKQGSRTATSVKGQFYTFEKAQPG
jgi:tartrate dehydratase alpha subunit/fumarate hydratase class I-like protein